MKINQNLLDILTLLFCQDFAGQLKLRLAELTQLLPLRIDILVDLSHEIDTRHPILLQDM